MKGTSIHKQISPNCFKISFSRIEGCSNEIGIELYPIENFHYEQRCHEPMMVSRFQHPFYFDVIQEIQSLPAHNLLLEVPQGHGARCSHLHG